MILNVCNIFFLGLERYLSLHMSLVFFLSQYLILCFKNNTVSASSTSKTSTGMVSSRTQPVSIREYMARNNKLQRHLADLLKQQSAKKETIPKLQQRYEGIQK